MRSDNCGCLSSSSVSSSFPVSCGAPLVDLVAPVKSSVLLEAERLVHGERQASYGHPKDDFSRTAALATIVLAKRLSGPLTPEDVAKFMVCVKLSREVNGHKRDNLVDLCGYVETLAMLREGR